MNRMALRARMALTAVLFMAGAMVTGCGEDTPSTSPETPRDNPPGSTSTFTMTAKVDGHGWAACCENVADDTLGAEILKSEDGSYIVWTFAIAAEFSGAQITRASDIGLLIEGVTGKETYPLAAEPGSQGVYAFADANGDSSTYETDAAHGGTVTITEFDNVNGTIGGTFSFTGTNHRGGTVHVTDGHFRAIMAKINYANGSNLSRTGEALIRVRDKVAQLGSRSEDW